MTLTEMQYIVALAESLHFGHAAKRCGVSQSNLSMAIKKIEASLPMPLFERTKHKVLITSFGQSLLPELISVVRRAEQITQIARADTAQLNQPLRMGAPLSVGAFLLPRFAAHWRIAQRSTPLDFYEAQPKQLMAMLECGELDLALTSQAHSDSHLVLKEIFSEPFRAVIPKQHALASHELISVAHLHQHAYLNLKGDGDIDLDIAKIFTPINCETIQCNQLETLKQFLINGVGFSLLPQSIADAWCNANYQLESRSIDVKTERKIYIAWRSSYTRTKLIEAVQSQLQKTFWPFTTGSENAKSNLLVENDQW